MRIEEFSIRRYGPLPDTGKIALGKFCLFFGNNEDGKTLTIDALTKILFGRSARIFNKIDRVEEEPDGFVIVKDDKGKEIKLPEKGDLTKLTQITPSDARNIFIIRNSDLSISKESEHYRNITDQLTGMKTEEIEKIKNCLLEIGKLTPGRDFRDVKDEKLRSRIKEARELIDKIGILNKEVKKENFDELEKKLSKISGRISQIEKKLKQYELAENREKYEKGTKALQTLDTAIKTLKELDVFTEEDEQEWAGHEQDIKREKERRKKLKRELKRLENKLEKVEKEFKKEKRKFEILDKAKKKIDDDIRPDLRNYEIKAGELEQKRGKGKFFTKSAIICAFLFMISTVGLIVNPSVVFFYALSIIFLFSALGLGISRFQLVKEEAWMKGMFERIKLDMAKFKLQGETVGDIFSNIQKFDDDYSVRKKELDEVAEDVNLLKREIKKLEEKDTPEVEKKIRIAEDGIREIISRSKVNTLTTYRKKLKVLQNKENLRDRQIEALKTLFGEEEEELSDNISNWREEINALKIYKDKATGIEYSKTEEDKLKEQKQDFLGKKETIEDKIKDFLEKLGDMERSANSTLKSESDFLHCKTSIDLKAIKERLKEFIENNENNRDNVSVVMNIFNEIEREEEEKVSSLFGKDSTISKYFFKITDGIYPEVTFIADEKKIYVKDRNEEVLDAGKLSGGAYDQLYLAIRLGLGESLLMGKKAFFIMDDPFIKADKKRLKEQIDILKKISKSGWQVLYFTAKDEVKEVLENDIKNKKIDYIEVQAIFS